MATNSKDPSIWYDQTKCFVDVFLKDLKTARKTDFWLETCNVHASAMAVEAVAARFKYTLPVGPDARPILNQAGLMFCMLYGRYGQAHAPDVLEGVAENEDARNLAWVLEQCADVSATYREYADAVQTTDAAVAMLAAGSAVVLSYLTDYGSGHYVALTGLDGDKIIAFDSWADNKHCSNRGVAELYDKSFFEHRARSRLIEVKVAR